MDGLLLLASSTSSLISSLTHANFAGHIIFILLLVYSVVVWWIMLGKYWSLKAYGYTNRMFQDSLVRGNPLRELRCPYALIWEAAVNRKNDIAVESVLDEQVFLYENKMVVLSSLGNGAPLVGLLGTVWGVMDAFSGIATAQNASLQALAPGVAGALLTTIMGLIVAIPASLGYNLLVSKIKKMATEMEHFANLMLESTAQKTGKSMEC